MMGITLQIHRLMWTLISQPKPPYTPKTDHADHKDNNPSIVGEALPMEEIHIFNSSSMLANDLNLNSSTAIPEDESQLLRIHLSDSEIVALSAKKKTDLWQGDSVVSLPVTSRSRSSTVGGATGWMRGCW
ncbi:hypothetical protein F2P56_036284 [Juglans regia]|uniref:Uncharacterized protein LOC109006499 isoform X1 n=2 Tax=Juglans regia TaxID=51240 RepID=A0A2I4GBQ6_JUGRE|nr:uncharacterized protein LOC109006499 isoform X1 [Juglans regia]KAF5443749.1 hypothetical protein F2P56_036284 [Juglans regia]